MAKLYAFFGQKSTHCMIKHNFYITHVTRVTVIAQDVIEIQLERPDGFTFVAGQFVQFKIKNVNEEVLRSYSLSSRPSAPQLEICLKLIPGGKASTFFGAIKVGDRVEMSEAQGRFIIEPTACIQKVFIATGAGLAPIMSMIEADLETAKNTRCNLIFGVRSEQDVFWLERLGKLKMVSDERFDFVVTLSQGSPAWQGRRGRVTDLVPDFVRAEMEYYLCGSVDMVKDVRQSLLNHTVNTKNIHFEIF